MVLNSLQGIAHCCLEGVVIDTAQFYRREKLGNFPRHMKINLNGKLANIPIIEIRIQERMKPMNLSIK
jgi:hypothetical protein